MNEDDEAQLLAAAGTTAASASAYEQSVISDALLRSAPQISLPHATIATNLANRPGHVSSSSLVPCGEERPSLPDLSSLAPSSARKRKDAAGDVPHVLRVLSRTRDLLQSALSGPTTGGDEEKRRRDIDLMRMKEQILLEWLANVAGADEDESIPRGKTSGRKRRRSSVATSAADEYYGYNMDENEASEERIAKKSAKKKASKSSGDAVGVMESEPSTNRLDRIKNGEQIDSTQKRPPKRQTMMQMKNQMRSDSGLAPLKSMEEERFDAEKSRKRREERRKRRLQRQRAALGIESSSEEEAEFEDSPKKGILKKKREGGEGEEKKSDDETATDAKKGGVKWDSAVEEKSPAKSPEGEQRTHTKVFCPICQAILTVDREEDSSAFLAQHIADCQKTSQSRNGGRTLRRRKKPAFVDTDNDAVGAKEETEPFAHDESEIAEEADEELEAEDEDARSKQLLPPTSVDDIDEYDYEDRVDCWIEKGLDRMGQMAERDSSESLPGAVVYEGGLEIPAWVNDRLFSYQRTGVRWMWELHCQGAGGVVGDEMGLGKTVQVSSFLGAMAASRFLESVLIVAPATMLAHWLAELARWAPGLRRILVHRSGESSDGVSRVISTGMLRALQKWLRKARRDRVNEPIDEEDYNNTKEHSFCGTGYVVLTTYEGIRRSPEEWTRHDWSYVVLDEGQKIRNPDADVTLAVKRLRTPHRLLLSGTPIQNELRELWSLFDFCFPGRLGTLPAFEAEFAEPIKRGGYSNASPMQVQLAYRCALVLRDLINPYLLRRQKKDIKEVSRMPGKTEQVLFCRLSSRQRTLYEEYLRSDEVMSVMRGTCQLLKAVTVLRKICNHPDLVTGPNGSAAFDNIGASSSSEEEDDAFYDEEKLVERSGKLQVLSKILPLWKKQGHKVIIFTQWRKTLHIIQQFVVQQEWKFARLDGNTNIASRQKLVDKFNEDDSFFCMLMTTRTGGVGLNITGANRVLIFDPDWNPQTDAQARERSWRFGQKRDVTVYRLITAGTIEEKIYQRQIFKTAITNQILQDPKQRRLFSQKDLRDLFSLKAPTKEVTETGEITKGRGVVEMPDKANKEEEDDEQPADNKDTLETVMKSKGLCGVFDHDFIENSSAKKSTLEQEMEDNAKKVARQARKTLKESSENQSRFEPTWTGSNETKQFGGASTNGAAVGGSKMASSQSLLANLQNKRMQIASSGNDVSNGAETDADAKKKSGLLVRIRKYIQRMAARGNNPTTRDILNQFKDVPDSDAALFRSLLKSVAAVKNGRWFLQEE